MCEIAQFLKGMCSLKWAVVQMCLTHSKQFKGGRTSKVWQGEPMDYNENDTRHLQLLNLPEIHLQLKAKWPYAGAESGSRKNTSR